MNMNMDMDRRTFFEAGTVAMMGMGVFGAWPDAAYAADPIKTADGTCGTPAELANMGGSVMTLDELNRRRHELVDSLGDFTADDGTVVPAIWNKLRALVDTYGFGCGAAREGESSASDFDFFKMMWTEEEAQAYLEMPYGVLFTATDFAVESGRDEDECATLCDNLASRGLLFRAVRGGVAYYHHTALAHGMWEYNLDRYTEPGWIQASNTWDFVEGDGGMSGWDSGHWFYYPVPVNRSITVEEEILPYDDWEKIVDRNTIFAVAPCQCRMVRQIMGSDEEIPPIGSEELKEYRSPIDNHYMETCMIFGEEAQYYLDKGIAREVDREEARAILQRSVDDGMVLQSAYTKSSEVVCACHGDCCGQLSRMKAFGTMEVANTHSAFRNLSHYTLSVDADSCVQCGACIERCPMAAISFGESGLPTITGVCVTCGQCATVCPAGARKLVAKDSDSYLELPDSMLDDYNLLAAYRFENGKINY